MIFPEFSNEADYLAFLRDRSALPAGFRVSTARIAFTPEERPTLEPYRMNLGLIHADEPTESFAGVFTKNAFPGAPVLLGRERLAERAVQGILVNNKIANVRAATGLEDARRLIRTLGDTLDVPVERLFSVSTGIIGWRLPVPEIESAVPELVSGLHGGSALDLAQAIMTTDSYPKVRRAEVGDGSILGIAKGAGMIEPNMATMLVFLLTDLDISRDVARRSLSTAVDRSFNAITVDGDMSTSDMALLLASGCAGTVTEEVFTRALGRLCGLLAQDVVRNGEGTGHVLELTVGGLESVELARGVAKAVANSPLVKTALYGNDPNVGRLLSAVGDYLGSNGRSVDPESVMIRLGDEVVFRNGAFRIDREKELRLSDYLKATALNARLTGYPQHQRCVEIAIDCGAGTAQATVWGSDLSDQYVHENADYRT
ncbi:MAG: bifunctional glutamate N-acetyltransferase/amino-acid acetyltransferase ArgJ [Spirochaetota bacterium]